MMLSNPTMFSLTPAQWGQNKFFWFITIILDFFSLYWFSNEATRNLILKKLSIMWPFEFQKRLCGMGQRIFETRLCFTFQNVYLWGINSRYSISHGQVTPYSFLESKQYCVSIRFNEWSDNFPVTYSPLNVNTSSGCFEKAPMTYFTAQILLYQFPLF